MIILIRHNVNSSMILGFKPWLISHGFLLPFFRAVSVMRRFHIKAHSLDNIPLVQYIIQQVE